jgi:hypothetical protein
MSMSEQVWEIPSAEGAIETLETKKRQEKRDYHSRVVEKLVRFWFDHITFEEENGVKYGLIAYDWVFGDKYYELNEYENDKNDVRDAVKLLAQRGWKVSPQYEARLMFFTVFKGIRLRQIGEGELPDDSYDWIDRLPTWRFV